LGEVLVAISIIVVAAIPVIVVVAISIIIVAISIIVVAIPIIVVAISIIVAVAAADGETGRVVEDHRAHSAGGVYGCGVHLEVVRGINVDGGGGVGNLVLAGVEGAGVHGLLGAHPKIHMTFAAGPILLALAAKILHDEIFCKNAT